MCKISDKTDRFLLIHSNSFLGPRFIWTLCSIVGMCSAAVSQPPPPPSSSAAAAGDAGEQSSHMHMKEKNDIVMVETNSSSK